MLQQKLGSRVGCVHQQILLVEQSLDSLVTLYKRRLPCYVSRADELLPSPATNVGMTMHRHANTSE